MADKKDLAEAQRYSRRRLVTAFTSGIPSDVELTPKKNQTPVIVGIGLTIIAVLVGVFYGYMKPALPDNWQNSKLIVAKNSAARYVSVNGRLHPVINAISARLMIPSSDFAVITVDDEQLEGIPIDSTLGILGAPDSLPARSGLVNGTATSCTYEHRLYNTISDDSPKRSENKEAVVAHVDGTDYLISNTKRYRLPANVNQRDGFLRAYGIPQTAQIDASIQWLNLFEAGAAMQPITIGSSEGAPTGGIRPGAIVMQQDAPLEARYVVMEDGSISHLDDVAYALYAIGKSDEQLEPIMLSASEFQKLTNAKQSPLPEDWPHTELMMTDDSNAMCAALPLQPDGDGTTAQFYTDDDIAQQARTDTDAQDDEANITTTIRGGTGVLMRASIGGNGTAGTIYAIDATGTAYPLPGAQEETLKRLGYTNEDVHNVPRGWVDIFPTGVELTPQAAASAPGAKKPEVETVKEHDASEQAERQ